MEIEKANNQEQDIDPINNVEFEGETDSVVEHLLRSIILSYQASYNNLSDQKNEIKYSITITNHKIATPKGNKDVAYLRLDKSIRLKGTEPQLVVDPSRPEAKITDEGWETKLVHQEVYFFRNLQERVNPDTPWKEQLYGNCLARLVGAGLEYGELLQRIKNTKETQTRPDIDETEAKLNKIGLVGAKDMPAPLTEAEKKYVEEIKVLRAQQGIVD